ncbi:DHA2 family multidrug resistance protein-like MFS transporter [Variovorax boronicumulans]|uniref:DHA2 family multidrug resistance protein-like MFS transporter n=1 Tax=Variovorax boronicumulans TaxID=436515 RepID=A0AAW8DX61_9BURK|nr:MFS transporter [Variovorax boronicumulans]MDP9878294.1 DHA2 family multidrug resistance protein-like MFS transporter [Variovorax boronicumulans]MDP9915433.1 DHA2 family multidrug resistance protein-like MFS transporter [Variovorax boronicumulans]MDP9923702.1 DHA2 family multidrug resistance protein-like MFS transporter [Variovorax boronicumulans]PBI93149.1 Methyl viologen resistance protein SmvA [Variovorax boronicumulans]
MNGLNPTAKKWITLGIVSMALLLIVVDMTVLYTALPTLTHDLAASATEKLWILNAYTVVVSGFLLGMGALGDRVGYRRMFVAGLSVFGIASLCAAYAPNPAVLIAARALLGVGASMMMPATLAILRLVFTDERERAVAIGVWASVASGGAALGPVVGGVLLEYFWWGSVFLINVPVVVLALVLALWLLPTQKNTGTRPWDFIGSVQVLAGLVFLVLTIKELTKFAPSVTTAAITGALAAVAMALFVRRQRRSSAPLIDFRLFRNAYFSGGVIAAIVASVALIGVELVFSQRLQLVVGLTPLQAGLTLLPLPLAAFVAGPLAGLLLARTGSRPVILGGLVTTALALCALALAVDAGGLLKPAILVVLGLGVGATITAASNAVMNNAPVEHAGMAASIEEVSYELGGVLGIALLGSVLSASYTAALVIPDDLAVPASAGDSIDAALLAAETLPAPVASQLVALAHTAFDQAFFSVMGVAVAIVVAAACAVALLGWRARPTAAQRAERCA